MIRRVSRPQQPVRHYNQSRPNPPPQVKIPKTTSGRHPELERNLQKMKEELKKLNEDVKTGRVEIEVLDSSKFQEAMEEARRNRIPSYYYD